MRTFVGTVGDATAVVEVVAGEAVTVDVADTVSTATFIGTCTTLGAKSTLVKFVSAKFCVTKFMPPVVVIVITPIDEFTNIGVDVADVAPVPMGNCIRITFGAGRRFLAFLPSRVSRRRLVGFAFIAMDAAPGVKIVSVVEATSLPSRSFLYSSQANLCSSSVSSSVLTFWSSESCSW